MVHFSKIPWVLVFFMIFMAMMIMMCKVFFLDSSSVLVLYTSAEKYNSYWDI